MMIKERVKQSWLYPLASAINKNAKAIFGMPKKISNIVSPKTIVLLYHRVCELENDPEQLAIPPKQFEKQILYLKSKYTIVSLKDFYKNLQEKKIKKNGILITFDDGYRDNFSQAFPILKKYQIPAVIFVAGGENADTEFWWDELAKPLRYSEDLLPKLHFVMNEVDYIFDTSSAEKIKHAYMEIHQLMKSLSHTKREMLFDELYIWKNMTRTVRPEYARISKEECDCMSASWLISIGGHTKNHCQLSQLSFEEQKKEISENFEFIKKIENKSPLAFAYPFGTKSDYTETTKEIVKKYYKIAFANFKGQIGGNSDPYELPRFVIKNWDQEEFQKKIQSFFVNVY